MPRSIAINVAANTNLPGFRGPVYPDGTFEYVPIPERKPTREPVPTYDDLDLRTSIPPDVADRRVHLDPEFAGVHGSERWTYGDEHGVKAGPLSALEPGDSLFFYATLDRRREADENADGTEASDRTPEWGAYLVGEFRVDLVVTGAGYDRLSEPERRRFRSNAHVKRESFDARVLVAGGPESRLFDRAVPLSTSEAGGSPNRLVTDLSEDSGRGPWWRRPLRFDEEATEHLRAVVADGPDAVEGL